MYDARIDATCAYYLELILTLRWTRTSTVLRSRLDIRPLSTGTRQVPQRSGIQKGIETCGLARPEISAMPAGFSGFHGCTSWLLRGCLVSLFYIPHRRPATYMIGQTISGDLRRKSMYLTRAMLSRAAQQHQLGAPRPPELV